MKIQNPARDTSPASLRTPTDLKGSDTKKISEALNALVANSFVLYLKTKNFHWHMNGPNFRDYHLLLDEQADQIFATIDPLAERVRKIGRKTIHSFAHIGRLATIKENDSDFVRPLDMLLELAADNKATAAAMRKAHSICDDAHDIATASLLEMYVDETERRTWFLFESAAGADSTGH